MYKNSFRALASKALVGILFLVSARMVAGQNIPKSGAANSYRYNLDLSAVKNDQLPVELLVPALKEKEAVFHLPKIVPGTYHVYDFGKYVHNFHAYDNTGKELNYTHPDANTWKIQQADKLARLSYKVDDTFDSDSSNTVFEPAGSNFEVDSDYVLNTHALFGYFEGYKSVPFEINVRKPAAFYGSTALEDRDNSNEKDRFEVPSYMVLADSPIMYSKPDTSFFNVGSAKILVSVYEKDGQLRASKIASKVKDVLEAAKNYLGGDLPIRKYAFIIYLFNGNTKSGASGALEHSYSSFYSLPEGDPEQLGPMVRDVAAHEFYHVITPLTIHAEQIGDFDYINPKMSEHLWLYEGVTEYTAHYVQLREGLTDLPKFITEMGNKIRVSKTRFNDTVPFTVMSSNVLTKQYENEYSNVYAKGAIIGWCLDIKIRSLSNGEFGLQKVIEGLSKKYGKDKSFKDADLFNDIEKLTFPEIGTFLRRYVGGPEPLPLEEVLATIGLKYAKEKTVKDWSLGRINLGYNRQTNRLIAADISDINEVGKELGIEKGDELVSLDGVEIEPQNFEAVLKSWKAGLKEGQKFKLVVMRKKSNGKLKRKKLKAHAMQVEKRIAYQIEPEAEPTAQQAKILRAWLGK